MSLCIEKSNFMPANCNSTEPIIIIKYLSEGCEMIFRPLTETFLVRTRFDKKKIINLLTRI